MGKCVTEETFWDRVSVGGPYECWEWNRPRRMWDGRGQLRWLGRSSSSSRVAWSLWAKVTPPSHLFVCHTCNNPPCCNPAHLYLATHRENQQYAVACGTQTNARKTHCPQGHVYSGDNLYIEKRNGERSGRKCKTCRNARMKEWHQRVGKSRRAAKKLALAR